MFRRFTIDTEAHLLDLVIDEDASTAAGAARFRAACSCGQMPQQEAGTREGAMTRHLDHLAAKARPDKGPGWLPEGARIAILAVAMLAIWGTCYAAGQFIAQDFTGAAAKAILGASTLTGLALAFALMISVRRYIVPR